MSRNNFNNLYNKSFTIARARTSDAFAGFSNSNYSQYVKKNHVITALIIFALVFAFFAGRFLGTSSSSSRISAPAPIATQALNKKFEFPLRDDNGKVVSKISYSLESADLQSSFVYQGKLATAVKGREFLIIDLKITNPYKKTIQVNAKDYVRVKVNGANEQLAPEIHNDPVEVQSNSTKYTRIGLAINESDKNIVLMVGELQGQKQSIALNLK